MAKHAKHAAPPRRRRSAQKHTSHKGVTLYTLGVLLVAVSALLSLRLWPRRIVDAVPPATEAESPAVSEELVVPEPQPVVTTLRFSATGDNLIHAPIYSQAARRAAEGEGYSFDYCYANLLDFYAQQDINWINQETLCSKELAPSTYPCFSTPGECAEALYRAGFRVFSLSNNHTYDKGAAGIAATLRFWETMPEDVITTGLWKGEVDYGRIPIQTVDGVKIAYLSYTEHTNGIPRNSKMTANIIYTSQQDVMEQQVRAARQTADFVVVGRRGQPQHHAGTAHLSSVSGRLGRGCDHRHPPARSAGRRMAHRSRWAERLCGLFAGKFPEHPEQTRPAHRRGPDTGSRADHRAGRKRPLRGARPEAPCDSDPL